mgnify:CR=1 FL=1
MNIEERIRASVLDQDHLADLLRGNEASAHAIMVRVIELLRDGRIELYTYASGGGVEVLDFNVALEIAANPKCWSWRSEHDEEQLYFLSPVYLENGSLAYGS